MMASDLPDGWEGLLPRFTPEQKQLSTRKANGPILDAITPKIPELIGGSADLAPSNITHIMDSADFQAESYHGRVLHFGVREHAMGAILNGLTVHGGIKAFGATFFTFSDYLRPAIRMGALMKLPVIYVFTHDSVAVGEDGPTHQPIEQLTGLRSIPNITVIRPCDVNEVSEAWKFAISNKCGPTCLVLSRQDLPILNRKKYPSAKHLQKGAYILVDPETGESPDLILIGTGSEVHLALDAKIHLDQKGIKTRVVSMPSWELFTKQSKQYQESVFPVDIKSRISIEAGSTFGWDKWIGDHGIAIGIDMFGASGPAIIVLEKYGFTAENIVKVAEDLIHGR
jgi:transketolase